MICKANISKHVQTVINKMGTCKNHALNKGAQQIWGFCQQFHIWITSSHIPGKENFQADFESKREYKNAEWMLNPKIFNKTQKIMSFQPHIDCFATSCLNNFQGDQTQKQKLQILLQLIGIPICAMFFFPLNCHQVYCQRFKWSK